ncbi:hypothetical protein KBC86_01900 [Candidatus Gracilibacteria bacterium]|nr:hypothetical protein [Candidatus Gracilibacteria bacterium]
MFHFFLSHLRSNIFRSLSMFAISGICIIVLTLLSFLYQNSSRALTYYNYNIIDDRRFSLSNDTSYFDMFSKISTKLPMTLANELEGDEDLTHVQAFSLVELPVLAKFSLFEFALETDIPIFSVTDSALSGDGIPIGMSRAMIDFYNVKIAGSSAMFPKIPELLITGQPVKITFGSSKIFPPLSRIASPIDGKITKIDENFPGFGLTLPETIVRQKMQELGYNLSPPYKIVAYMKDVAQIPYIEKKYSMYHLQFDAKMKQELDGQVDLIRNTFLGIALFFTSILAIFFTFLLFSFFRERRDVFRLVYIFGLSGIRARILTLAEPLLLLITGSILGSIIGYSLIGGLVARGTKELIARGISYPLTPLPILDIGIICLFVCTVFALVIIILEYFWRQKSLLR